MRLLDRYLLRELLVPLSYCLGGFLIFWISFDLFAEMSRFQEESFTAREVARYYGLRIPEFLVLVMPIALLLSLLYGLTNHARHHEITAIRAAGVSLTRLSMPYFGVGLMSSLVLFVLNEVWVPRASQAADELLKRGRTPAEQGEAGRWHYNLPFRNARDGRIWFIRAFNLETFEMRSPQVEWRLPDNSRRTLIGTNAVWRDGVWVFQGVDELVYPPPSANQAVNTNEFVRASHTNEVAVPEFSETPAQIRSEIKITQLSSIRAAKEVQLSLEEIIGYLRLHPDVTPRLSALLHTQLHARLAAPWTSLVVVLIAIPFAAASGRRNVFVGVASSIFICFAYFTFLRLGLALGTGGYMPPWLAAWLPNLSFSLAGVYLAGRVR